MVSKDKVKEGLTLVTDVVVETEVVKDAVVVAAEIEEVAVARVADLVVVDKVDQEDKPLTPKGE